MSDTIQSTEEYIQTLPENRKEAFVKLLHTVRDNIPEGFEEQIQYGMIGFVVPHSLYPSGYHAKSSEPLPFAHIASQKHHIALYHSGLYSDKHLLAWFRDAYKIRVTNKLDMGKSCIRFKKFDEIPYDLIAELMQKISPKEWIALYERVLKK